MMNDGCVRVCVCVCVVEVLENASLKTQDAKTTPPSDVYE